MKIKLNISNRIETINLKLDTENKVCQINDVVYDVNVEELAFEIYTCVYNWPKKLKRSNVIDGETYNIIIEQENKIEEFVGINAFPPNYGKFKQYIYNILKNEHKN